MKVHRTLGHGFPEAVCQEALEYEFVACGIPFVREFPLPIRYRGNVSQTGYRADFLCHGSILVKLKVLQKLSGTEESQVINHLKASELEKAMLISFGAPSLEYKRLILSLRKSAQSVDVQNDPPISQEIAWYGFPDTHTFSGIAYRAVVELTSRGESAVTIVWNVDAFVARQHRFGKINRNEFAFAESAVRYDNWTNPETLDG